MRLTGKLFGGEFELSKLLAECRKDLENLQQHNQNMNVQLAVIQVGNTDDNVDGLSSKASSVGVEVSTHMLPSETSRKDLVQLIDSLNGDDSVNGIVVNFDHNKYDANSIDDIYSRITHMKDVAGNTGSNAYMLSEDTVSDTSVVPVLADAIFMLIKASTKSPLYCWGKQTVILTDSFADMAATGVLLANQMSNVTMKLVSDADCEVVCKSADILIVSIGKPGYVNGEFVKKNGVVIDLGVEGDVDWTAANSASFMVRSEAVIDIAEALTLKNTIKLAKTSLNVVKSSNHF